MGVREGRHLPVAVFAVFLLGTVAMLALFSYAPIKSTTSATTEQKETTAIYVEVVNASNWSTTAPGVEVVAGPASSLDDIMFTPGGGPTLKECVRVVPSGSSIEENGTVVYPNGTSVTTPQCPLKSYTIGESGTADIFNATGSYYFVSISKEFQYNYALFAMNDSSSITVVIPWPSGNVVVSSESRAAVNPGGDPPFWPFPIYLEQDVGTGYSCSLGPCWGGNLSSAIVFNCATEAATPAGCRTTVTSSAFYWEKYNLTIWYPDINESFPLMNCQFQTTGHPTLDLGAWCSAVGPDSFVMSEAPPPPA